MGLLIGQILLCILGKNESYRGRKSSKQNARMHMRVCMENVRAGVTACRYTHAYRFANQAVRDRHTRR